MLAWLSANWQQVILWLVAVDSVLMSIFPQVGIFAVIKNFLSGLVPAAPAAPAVAPAAVPAVVPPKS